MYIHYLNNINIPIKALILQLKVCIELSDFFTVYNKKNHKNENDIQTCKIKNIKTQYYFATSKRKLICCVYKEKKYYLNICLWEILLRRVQIVISIKYNIKIM